MTKKDNSSLIGEKFTRLKVLSQTERPNNVKNKARYWKCVCDCGNIVVVSTSDLRRKRKQSCNCLQKDRGCKLRQSNKIVFDGDYVKIYDSKKRCFTVDRHIYESKIRDDDKYWFVVEMHGINYVATVYDKTNIYLHRYILNPDNKSVVDHIDGDGTNNILSNMRVVTQKKNTWNRGLSSLNTSGHTGVSFSKNQQKWKSCITVNGKRIHLGFYESKNNAINARIEAEIEHFGEYSRNYADKVE